MQLVVLGGQTLDELQKMVIGSFSGVAGAAAMAAEEERALSGTEAAGGQGRLFPKESAAVAAAGLPFDASALGRAFRMQPVKDIHRLHVTWQLGEQQRCYCLSVCPCM